MQKLCVVLVLCIVALSAFALFAQTSPQPKWQSGTVTAVAPHAAPEGGDPDRKQYEVSLRVGDTVYVVLYTAPPGSQTVEYRVGTSLQVLVKKDTLTFNDLLGRANTVPVLRRDIVRERSSQ